MAALLQSLQDLQQVEMKLHALRDKIDAKRRQVRAYDRKLKRFESEVQEIKDKIMRKQAEVAQHELDIKTHDEEVAKLREALNRSKTNKEYAAILSQINTDKADTSKVEDRILEILTEIETLKQEQAVLVEKQGVENKKLESAKREADSFSQTSSDELGALERGREQAASDVPPEALALFERASERHDGEVLAAVLQPHPKRQEFICEGCNMTVTLEQYVSLKGRDSIQVCQNCSRVLVLEEALAR